MAYYTTGFQDYFSRTVSADPSSFLEPFARELPENADILDVGCGSGRDLLWLRQRGFSPRGLEQSPGLAELARIHSGCQIIQADFETHDFSGVDAHGILLVGVLVHLPGHRLKPVLENILQGLRSDGTMLLTLKQGSGAVVDDLGRRFTLWQDPGLRQLFFKAGLCVVRFRVSGSALNTGESWLEYHLMRLTHPDLMAICSRRRLHHGPRFSAPFLPRFRSRTLEVLKWKLFSPNRFTGEYSAEPRQAVHVDWDRAKRASDTSVTFVRHAFFFINDRGRYLFVDPVFFRISRLIRDFSPLAGGISGMPDPHHVLITHGHYDHLDRRSLKLLARRTHVITPLGYDTEFRALGMENRIRLDWFESFEQEGLKVTLVPSRHWTMRNPFKGPNRSLWGSYIIETSGGFTIYVAGDTAWFNGFREIGRRWRIDLAVFNLGAYEPRWFMDQSHMNPSQAVRAFRDLRARRMMIGHWGTFRLGDEPIHFPPRDIMEELDRQGLSQNLAVPGLGTTFVL
ncbi:MAG: MBL fold metallo-hydrolase [Pseudomonadota bacterium]